MSGWYLDDNRAPLKADARIESRMNVAPDFR
jgi:hypothetical protein